MTRILVADDEPEVRRFLTDALETHGHQVLAVADGVEAANALLGETFPVVVTDWRMPRRDGMALLTQLRSEEPKTQVIVLTAHASVEHAVEAMRLGALDYIEKPISSPTKLRLLVSRAFERYSLLAGRERRNDNAAAVPLQLGYGDPATAAVESALRKVARTDATLLLLGETGTGKEVAARTLHAWSARAERPFVAVNCAALSESLLESELFGHERGAFTGAHQQRQGRLELAEGGTFFLDEVGELKLDLQAKLLRVLQQGEYERVGGTRTLRARVRWVAATNRDLGAMVRSGAFREDLYHRLAVFPLRLPPLRERPLDLEPLTDLLLARIAVELERPGLSLSEEARQRLQCAELRGNIRELANVLERAAILSDQSVIAADLIGLDSLYGAQLQSLDSEPPPSLLPPPYGTLEQLEREAIRSALQRAAGHRKRAADTLGIGLRTLYDKLKRYELD